MSRRMGRSASVAQLGSAQGLEGGPPGDGSPSSPCRPEITVTTIVTVRTGNWGGHAMRALTLLKKGFVVELVVDGQVLGYMTPRRLPITDEVIDHIVQHKDPDAAARWRDDLVAMQAPGEWYYDPLRGVFVTGPALPDFPRAPKDDE